MSWQKCPGCGEVMTPELYRCVTCSFSSKQDLEQYIHQLRVSESAAWEALRDKCAMAALDVADRNIGSSSPDDLAVAAYHIADAMLARREILAPASAVPDPLLAPPTDEDRISEDRRAALEELLLDIEPAEGAEEGISVEVALREAASHLITIEGQFNQAAGRRILDLASCLETLAHRFEEAKDQGLHD